jgi:Alcohol dehydrogenase GroES-like domain
MLLLSRAAQLLETIRAHDAKVIEPFFTWSSTDTMPAPLWYSLERADIVAFRRSTRDAMRAAAKSTKALSLGEAVEHQPAADEILINAHAASVSYMDYLMSCGGYQMRPPLPYIPGTDAAGVVVAVGANVTRFFPGDGVACGGWYAALPRA